MPVKLQTLTLLKISSVLKLQSADLSTALVTWKPVTYKVQMSITNRIICIYAGVVYFQDISIYLNGNIIVPAQVTSRGLPDRQY